MVDLLVENNRGFLVPFLVAFHLTYGARCVSLRERERLFLKIQEENLSVEFLRISVYASINRK